MPLQNEFAALATEATLAAARNRLPAALNADGGLITHVQNQIDIADRSGRVVGHVTVDNASLTADVADRVGRLLGHVQIDNFPASQTVAGTVALDAATLAALEHISIDNLPGVQPVSATSLPLPTGAATESTLSGVKTGTDRIPVSPATDRATAAAPAAARLSDGAAFYKPTTPTDTQPVSAASLPLPTGAATDRATAAAPGAARLSDGTSFYKSTTPSDIQPVSAASLPLPAGAATDSTLSAVSSAAGATTDVEASGNGSLVAILKRIRTLLSGGLPTALSSNGGLKIEQVVAGPTQPVSGTVTVSNPTTNPETGLAKDATLTTSIGAQADAEATGSGSSIAILKRLRTLLNGGLPAALSANGGLKVEQVIAGPTQPVSGTVTANAGSGPWPVTDNGGSLTVDGTVTANAGTGTFPTNPSAETAGIGVGAAADVEATGNGSGIAILKRLRTLLAGGLPAALVGGRLDVNVGNTPTVTANAGSGTLAVSMAAQTPDVTDRAAREVGRVRLWDGVDEATVIQRGTASASTDKGIAIVPLIAKRPTYQVVTAEITSATTTGVKELLTAFKAAASTKDVFIIEVGVNFRVIHTAGTFAFELQLISAENATPGGTAVTAQPLNRGDAASDVTWRTVVTGAPTVAGQIFQRASFPLPAAASPLVGPGIEGMILYRSEDPEGGIQLRAGQGDGLRISQDIIAALTTAPVFNVYARYVERA